MNAVFQTMKHGEIELHYAAMGDPARPLLLCLHGFPEYWAAWADVMPFLAERFFVVAPDQRGFNLSSKPLGVDAYQTRNLVADIVFLADRLSPEKPFVLAGHDWGSAVAYAFAFRHPHRLSALVVANGAHPACFQRAILENQEQRRASQYMNRLRADGAEVMMSENNYARTLNMIAGFSKNEWMTKARQKEYLDAWSQQGAMHAMLNWYRASSVVVPEPDDDVTDAPILRYPDKALTVRMPHLVLWGEEDEALTPACLDGLQRFAGDIEIRRVGSSGHWILHEQPQVVADAIGGFLRERGL